MQRAADESEERMRKLREAQMQEEKEEAEDKIREEIEEAMRNAGCAITASDLKLDSQFYRDAVQYGRFIRDRFSMLDLVDDSDGLQDFVASMTV